MRWLALTPESLFYDARMPRLRRYLDLVLLTGIGMLLVAFPALDLAVSGAFYDPFDGFRLKTHTLVRFIYDLVPRISRVVRAPALILFLLGGWLFFRRHASSCAGGGRDLPAAGRRWSDRCCWSMACSRSTGAGRGHRRWPSSAATRHSPVPPFPPTSARRTVRS
ncbi:MAG: hypothetical protein MZV65_19345 [Chromatiales bacterium]|nr:hypothetical protein [Chromatiales bacterium]